MSVDGFFRSFNLGLDEPVRRHLKSVYASLALCVFTASVGAYVHVFTNFLSGGGIIFSLLGLGLILALHGYPDNGKNRKERLAMLLGFAFFAGLGAGPLLDTAFRINARIIPSAFLLSSSVFASFSGVALFAPQGKYLYLGGSLMAGLSTMFWLTLFSFFTQSQMVLQISHWLGLVIFCGFIIWDTQVIILKRQRGDKDFIAHSLDLFLDFIEIFKRIVIIFMQKERDDNRRRRRN